MGSVEILALILAVITILKGIAYAIDPKKMLDKADLIVKNIKAMQIVIFILMVVIGWIVIDKLGVISVMAAIFFGLTIIALTLLQYPGAIKTLLQEMSTDKKVFWQKNGLAFFIWSALAIAVLLKLFINFPE